MNREYYVYILSNHSRKLYIGVTNDLIRRVYEHKEKYVKGFTEKYNLSHLVYYEIHQDITEAILREKRIKKWKREWKIKLIEENNPLFEDIYETLI